MKIGYFEDGLLGQHPIEIAYQNGLDWRDSVEVPGTRQKFGSFCQRQMLAVLTEELCDLFLYNQYVEIMEINEAIKAVEETILKQPHHAETLKQELELLQLLANDKNTKDSQNNV